MSNSYPSVNPADQESLGGTFSAIYRKQSMETWCQMPAVLEQYDRVRNVATVRPLITVWHTNGNTTPRAAIVEVPVLALGGGKCMVSFDLQPGDLGWIEASDRDISLFMQSLTASRPASERIHALEDSRFVPDVFRSYTLAESASGHMVIQSTDGDTAIALQSGHVSVTTSGSIDVTAPLTELTGDLNISGKVTITGALVVNGIDFSTHVHISAVPGQPTSVPQE